MDTLAYGSCQPAPKPGRRQGARRGRDDRAPVARSSAVVHARCGRRGDGPRADRPVARSSRPGGCPAAGATVSCAGARRGGRPV